MSHDHRSDHLHIHVSGELSLDASAEFRERLRAVGPTADAVVVDLAGLTFMTSIGVGALVEFKRNIELRGGRLTLENLQPPIRSIFEISKLDAFFGLPPAPGS